MAYGSSQTRGLIGDVAAGPLQMFYSYFWKIYLISDRVKCTPSFFFFFSLRNVCGLLGWLQNHSQALLPWTAQWEVETWVTPVGLFVFISIRYIKNYVWLSWTFFLIWKSHSLFRKKPLTAIDFQVAQRQSYGPSEPLCPCVPVAATGPSYMLPIVVKPAYSGVLFSTLQGALSPASALANQACSPPMISSKLALGIFS